MSVSLVYLPEAEDDAEAAQAHYERQREGLGTEFAEELQKTMDRISDQGRRTKSGRKGRANTNFRKGL